MILCKCKADKQRQIRSIFEKQPFGELERLVTQKLLDVVKKLAKEELQNEDWLRLVAQLSNRSYEEMRVAILEFLDTDVVEVSIENCVSFLDPLIERWDIDLATFAMEIVQNQRVAPGQPKKYEFIEKEPVATLDEEPGFKAFLHDPSLSGDATEKEIEFLRKLRFQGKRPAPLYYYRELQNLRDPYISALQRNRRIRLIEEVPDAHDGKGCLMKEHSKVHKIAFLGDHLPRKCGIATFTADLLAAVAAAHPESQCLAVSVNDIKGGYDYPEVVRFEIEEQDLSSYLRAADFLNISNVDIVCLQHEFGIFRRARQWARPGASARVENACCHDASSCLA